MDPFAELIDLERSWRPLDADEQPVAAHLLEVAAAIIRSAYPGIDDRLDAGTLDLKVVAYVNATMVARVIRNPDGLRAESLGDWSGTYIDAEIVPEIVLTADDRRRLNPRSKRRVPRSVRLHAGLG